MEENKTSLILEKNEFKFKILYLIRKNLPKSEFIYLLMFLLKYVGLILFCISLNVFDTRNNSTNNSNNPEHGHMHDNELLSDFIFRSEHPMGDHGKDFHEENNNNKNTNNLNSNNMIQKIFRKLLINGDSYKILNNSYQLICTLGFIVLIVYILLWIYVYFYMRKKYYNKTQITITDKKINEINQNDTIEKRVIKCLTYFLFLIVFFHQYIIEYYIFGCLGYSLNKFGALNTSEDQNDDDSYIKYMNKHFKNLILPEIFIIFINLVTIIILLAIFILFFLINSSKTLYITKNYPLYSNEKNLVINVILLNLNPLYSIVNYFKDDTKLNYVFIFIIIITFLVLIKAVFCYYYFSPLPFKLECLCIFVEFFALFGCITNIITYLTKSELNSTKFNIIKAIFELMNALVFTLIFIRKKKEKNMKIFSDNLFSTNLKSINPSAIYFYITKYIYYSQNKTKNYMSLFTLIQNHVLKCQNKDCPEHKLLPKSLSYSIFTDFKHYLKESNISESIIPTNPGVSVNFKEKSEKGENKGNIKDSGTIKKSALKSLNSKKIIKAKLKNDKIRRESINIDLMNNDEEENINYNKKMLEDVEFKMIGEQEIINRINFLYRRKKLDYIQTYIFLHLQYIIKIKQNYRLALYFLSKYSQSEIKFSFLSRYYFYEIKNYINNSILNEGNINLISDPYIKKYKEENIKLDQLIEYISLFNIVRKIIKVSCESIIQFYSFRRELHNSLSLQKYRKTKIYQILQSSERLQSAIYKLQFLLDKLNKDKKHSLESIELSYLICNFFKLLEGRIPQEILCNVKPILHFKDALYDQLINEFHLFMMNNPLIIGLKSNDTFNIVYFTNIFMKKLDFSFSDLKYKDFHEKLFPGNQELIKEHTLILKQFLFFQSNTYNKIRTFVKSKEGYLVPVNITSKVFPTFLYDFLLITNVRFSDNLEKGNLNMKDINNNKGIKDIKNIERSNNLVNTYSFMLNNEYEIFSLTKNFYLEYNLNQAMFRELRINFCQFFCIDENKLSCQIISERKKILKENPQLNNQISLKESNKAYTIFQNISMKNLFKIREEKLIITYNYPDIYIYDKIDKKKLIKKIPEIINIIDEIGLDYDWYMKLQKYKDRLTLNIDESKLTFNTHNFEQFFEVIFSIKKLGNFIYFVVNLNETYNTEIESKVINHKSMKRKSYTNNNKKLFQKMGTTMTNKLNKTSIKSINSKNRKSVLTTGITHTTNTLKNNNDKSSSSISDGTIPHKKINFNIEEKEDKEKNDKDKNLIETKKTKKISIYDNTEYLKSFKNKKKLYSEDDENTPLLTRDKFNDILSRKNKVNKIFILILYILILIALFIIIAKAIQSLSAIDENLKVLEMTINIELLKVDLYLEAILSIHYCIIEQKNPLMKLIYPQIQKAKLGEMMEHLNQIQKHVETILNNKNSFGIFQVIENKFLIASIGDDLSISVKKADLLEEVRRLSYVIGNTISDSDDSCDIDMIYEYSVRGNDKSFFKDYRPTYKQKLFFYFVYNVLKNYKTTFEILSEECDSSLLKMWNLYEETQMYFIIFVVIDLIIFFVMFCVKYCLDTSFYQLLFLYYYKIENEQKNFETQIYYLYKTNLEFNFENIKYFEEIKKNCDIADLYNIEDNNNNSDLSDYKKRNSFADKNNVLEQNSMNGSLLNSSMNGSSIHFLNRGNKLNLNNRIENNSNTPYGDKIEENPDNNISQEETIESLMKFIINILPNSHKNSLFFIILNFIIYLGICSVCIYEIIIQIYQYDFSINLSMNILERTPRIMELVLYSTITVLINRTTTLIQNVEHQSPYLKYFSIDSLYYSEEMLQKFFQGNFYGQLLKDNLKLKYNLENYLYNKYSTFKNVQYWETMLNSIGDFCINLPKGLLLSGGEDINKNISNLYDFMQQINDHAVICKTQSTGMKDSGVKIEFNFILQEITTKYIEFIIYERTNVDGLNKARQKFINNTDFEKIINDARMYLLFYFNTITYAVKKDFEKQNNETKNGQIIYSVLFLIVNVEIIISLIFIFSKGEKYKKLFSYFSTIPKSDIINI